MEKEIRSEIKDNWCSGRYWLETYYDGYTYRLKDLDVNGQSVKMWQDGERAGFIVEDKDGDAIRVCEFVKGEIKDIFPIENEVEMKSDTMNLGC